MALIIAIFAINFYHSKNKKMLQDVYNAAFSALIGEKNIALKTNSRSDEFLTGRVVESDISTTQNSEGKVFQIASITKTFTAASLVKLAGDEKYSQFFNAADPMSTSLASFEKIIEEWQTPNVKEYFAELKKHPHYQSLTLRHLLNHTSGVDQKPFFDEFRKDQTQSFHLSQHLAAPLILDEEFGKFHYSDANYNNILAPIIESVVSAKAGKKVEFSSIVKEQIIAPLALQNTFMGDEMALENGEVVVKNNAKIAVAQGRDYCNGKVQTGQDFNYDFAAGGIYSTANDVAKFYQSMLEGSLFDEKAAAIFFDEKNFVNSDDARNTATVRVEGYGLGIRKIFAKKEDGREVGVEYFHHGGAGIGFYSHVIGQRNVGGGAVQVASAFAAYENITRPIAAALLGDEKKKGELFVVDEELLGKMTELAEKYPSEKLVAMRQELDSLQGSFSDKSAKFKEQFAANYPSDKPAAFVENRDSQKLQSAETVQHQ